MPRITPRGITSDEDPACSAPVWTVFNLPDHKGSGFDHGYGIGERIAWSSSDPGVADVKVVENKRLSRQVPVESGCFEIKKAGRHKFRLASNDGTKMWLDGKLLIDNDGRHDFRVKVAETDLKPGFHSLRVDYFQWKGKFDIGLRYITPGGSKGVLVHKDVLHITEVLWIGTGPVPDEEAHVNH